MVLDGYISYYMENYIYNNPEMFYYKSEVSVLFIHIINSIQCIDFEVKENGVNDGNYDRSDYAY